jgi:hypothetical protein
MGGFESVVREIFIYLKTVLCIQWKGMAMRVFLYRCYLIYLKYICQN